MKKMKLSWRLFLSILLHQTAAVLFEGQDGINQKISKLASFGNNVYTFYPETCCDISQANETCNKYNGFLAHIKTENITSFINDQIKEYRVADYKQPSHEGFWIGLHQIGEDTKKWEWSDKKELSYENWRENEPNGVGEKCVDLQVIKDIFGLWFDSSCSEKQKIICENRAGSGFVTNTSVNIERSEVKVQCVVFGGSEYTSVWLRNRTIVTNDNNKAVHQVYQRQANYFISTISFKDVLIEEAGTYNCFLKRNVNTLANLQLEVEAATMEVSKRDSVCKLNELLIDLLVYTSLPLSYNLSVLEAGNVDNFQLIQTDLSSSSIRISNLKANTNYSVNINLLPKYWSQPIKLNKVFATSKSVKPTQIKINRSTLTAKSICQVEFLKQESIVDNDLFQITVFNVKGENRTADIKYKNLIIETKKNFLMFSFKVEDDESDFEFEASLQSCDGNLGEKSESFRCKEETLDRKISSLDSKVVVIIILIILLVIITVVFIGIITRIKKKMKFPPENVNIEAPKDEVYLTADEIGPESGYVVFYPSR